MSPSEVKFLDDNFGKNKIKTVSISNIQSKSLGNLDASLKKDNQSAFRDKIKQNFSAPLVKLGDELIGKALVGNDRAEYASKLSSATNDPALFSDSVLGGIFESAIRVATKTVEQIGAFKDVDANSPFDFEEGGRATDAFKDAFKFEGDLFKADAKKTANAKTIRTIIGKSLRDGEVSGRIKSNYGRIAQTKTSTALANSPKLKNSADGYIPNFADALKEAVSREISAGLDPSQVYIDQSSSLKNAGNPMGLMVANRRDEPQGGFQGIARARKEGANAQFYGAASGFVPNYADPLTMKGIGVRSKPLELNLDSLNNKIKELNDSISKNKITYDKAEKELSKFVSDIPKIRPAAASRATTAAIQNLDQPEQKAKKDYLGVLIGLQIATSFLSGSFADATTGAGLFAKRLTDSAASLSASLFALEGLKSIGKEGTQLSKVMGKIGVVGQVAAIAFEGFSLGRQLLRDWNGETAKANKSTASFTDAVNAAGVSLNSLSQLEQVTRQQKAKDIIYNISGQKMGKVGTPELQKQIAEFQYLSGIEDPKKIKEILQKGGAMDYRNINSSAINADKAPEVLADYLKSEEGQKRINKLKEEQRDKTEAANKEEAKAQGISQINLDLAKQELKSTLDIASARFRINDSLDERLLSSEILKNLSEKETRDLKQQIDLRDNDRKLADATRSLLQDQIDKLSGVTGKEEERNKLKLEYAKLTDDDLTNQSRVRSLIEAVNALLTDGVNNSDSARKITEINLQNLFDTRDVQKDTLNINKQNTEEYTNQKDVIDGIIESAKRMSASITFQKTFAGQGQINTNELEIKRLESSKAGQSMAEQKQIDIRIKQLEKSNVLLNNDNKVSADLATAKEKAMAAIPNIDAAQTKKIQEQTSIPGIQAALESNRMIYQYTEDQQSKIKTASQEIEQMGAAAKQAAEQSINLAQADLDQASKSEIVTKALVLFQDSLYGIPQKLADLSFERGTVTSGRRLAEIDYEMQTSSTAYQMNKDGKSMEEIQAFQRQRSVKGIGQKFSEAFSETEFDRADRFSDTIVTGAEKFRDTMIDGMAKAIEDGSNLSDILRSSALDFARELTKTNLKNLTGGITGGVGSVFGFASGGKITGGSGNKDDVPAMLMGGEYVINKKSVSKYGSTFMESLNNGTLQGFAKGGSVIRGRGINSDVISNTDPGFQTGKGGFQMPGYYGQGTISGKKDLLSFATQAYTSGANDVISSGSDSSYIDLEGESVRLTNFGRRNGPMANAIRESKGQAFDLYKQQLAAEKQAREEEKARKEAFRNSIKMALISTAVGVVGKAATSGFQAGATSAGQDATIGERFGAGFKGIFSGGDIGEGVQSGGIKNLFSGNFALSQISSTQELSSYLNTNPNSDFAKQLRLNSPDMFNNGKFIERALPFDSNYSLFNGSSFDLPDGKETFGSPMDSSLLPPKTFKNATGGLIPSAGGIDTVPAMLSGGEFIMNAAATQRIGPSNLNAMNSGSSNTDSKDLNDKLISKLDELITASKESSKGVTVNVTSDGRGNTQESTEGQSSSDQDKNLSRKIKAAVVSVLQEEKRLGGVLRRR